jgi:tripartite-type tricarboxylate transporter receptor subunit TctC
LNHSQRKITAWLAAALLCLGGATQAQAQDGAANYPNRPIRLVVPYAAGGGTDVLARQVARKVSENLGQPVVVDNKPGAGTTLGAGEVAKAEPDGYTLLWGDNATFAVNPHVYKKMAYDPLQSFAPVTLTVKGALVLIASNRLGVKSVSDLVAHAKAHPNTLSYGTPGSGTPHHLTMEALKLKAGGLAIQHVPYRGEAPALQDLLGGSIDLMFAGARVAKPQVETARVVALAVSGSKRNAAMPSVPTVDEAGLKGFAFEYWHGVVAPAKTPVDIVNKINAAIVKALRAPDLVDWINNAGSGAEWTGSSPAEMQAHMGRELKASGELVQAIGLTAD